MGNAPFMGTLPISIYGPAHTTKTGDYQAFDLPFITRNNCGFGTNTIAPYAHDRGGPDDDGYLLQIRGGVYLPSDRNLFLSMH
jgi:hypothetical protein